MNTQDSFTDISDPVANPERLKEIAELNILDSSENLPLQEIVQTASREFDVPIALVSIVLDGAQYFVAMHGLQGWMCETKGTPSEWSFCIHAVRTQQPFIVEDASVHPLVHDNPLVTIDGIRCYAGAPLLAASGHALGALCVIGATPREFSEAEIERLRFLAQRVVEEIGAG